MTRSADAPAADTEASTADDFGHSPLVVFYEVTRACDLLCRHCRACAQPERHPAELDTAAARQLLDQLARFPKPPLLVLTGGDPLKREDLVTLIEHARSRGLRVAVTLSATPLVTGEAIRRLADAGVGRIAMSLDGADAATHDGLRGVAGSFARTRRIMADVRVAGVPLQVNTTVGVHNAGQIDAMAALLRDVDVVLWSAVFLVPVGRDLNVRRLTGEQCEQVFERLWHHARCQPFSIRTTEAPHYRRYVLQRKGSPRLDRAGGIRAPLGINDGRGVVFVSHVGQLCPSGVLPITCGRFPADNVIDVYQDAPLFHRLRDPVQVKGKCHVCPFVEICGGSRARAYALTRDPLAAEPDCIYTPPAWRQQQAKEARYAQRQRPAV